MVRNAVLDATILIPWRALEKPKLRIKGSI